MPNATDQVLSAVGTKAIKIPCKICTVANITLNGEQSINGVAVVNGDRVLVKSQTDLTQNGVYVCSTGNWTRAIDFNDNSDFVDGTLVTVKNTGVTSPTLHRTYYLVVTEPVVIGISEITFVESFGDFDLGGLPNSFRDSVAAFLADDTSVANGEVVGSISGNSQWLRVSSSEHFTHPTSGELYQLLPGQDGKYYLDSVGATLDNSVLSTLLYSSGNKALVAPSATFRASGTTPGISEKTIEGGDVDGTTEYIYATADEITDLTVKDFKAENISHTIATAAVRLGNDVAAPVPNDKIRKNMKIENFTVRNVGSSSDRVWGVSMFGKSGSIRNGYLENVGKSGSAWRQSEGVYTKLDGGIISDIETLNCGGHHTAESPAGHGGLAQGAITVKGSTSDGHEMVVSNVLSRWDSTYSSPASASCLHLAVDNIIANNILAIGCYGPALTTDALSIDNIKVANFKSVDATGLYGVRSKAGGNNHHFEFDIQDMVTRTAATGSAAGFRFDANTSALTGIEINPKIKIDPAVQAAGITNVIGISLVPSQNMTDIKIRNGKFELPSGGSANIYGMLLQGSGTLQDMCVTGNDFSGFGGPPQNLISGSTKIPTRWVWRDNIMPVRQTTLTTPEAICRFPIAQGSTVHFMTRVVGVDGSGNSKTKVISAVITNPAGTAVLSNSTTLDDVDVGAVGWAAEVFVTGSDFGYRADANGATAQWRIECEIVSGI